MSTMFSEATDFNQNIGWNISTSTDWDVSLVNDMSYMFSSASNFDGDISGWVVSAVTNMSNMFESTRFNKDISGWDISIVSNMGEMFKMVTHFNQDISGWRTIMDTAPITSWYNMYDGTHSGWKRSWRTHSIGY